MVDRAPLSVQRREAAGEFVVVRDGVQLITVPDDYSDQRLRDTADACLAVLAARAADGALAVDCPVCDAAPGVLCTVGLPDPAVSSTLREVPHHARQVQAWSERDERERAAREREATDTGRRLVAGGVLQPRRSVPPRPGPMTPVVTGGRAPVTTGSPQQTTPTTRPSTPTTEEHR